MADDYSKPNWQNSDIHLITDLPPYQNMNYAKEQQDMKFEWEQDDKDDNEQRVVLSEAETSKELVSNQSINIYAGTNENADLSNFATRPFNYNIEDNDGNIKTIKFNSVEQGFHYMKAITANRQDIADSVLNTNNPKQAKFLTSPKNLSMTKQQLDEWNSISKSDMLKLMFDSFQQNPQMAQKLLSTGDSKLTHMYNGKEQDSGRFSEVITVVRGMLREEGYDVINRVKDQLTELSKDNTDLASKIDDKIEEFTQLLRKENPTTPEEVEGLINKFICNL